MTVILDDHPLFDGGSLAQYLEQKMTSALNEAGEYDKNSLLGLPFEDIVSCLVAKFQVEPIVLETDITTDEAEAQISTSRIPNGRFLFGDHQPTVPGTRFRFYVPFKGDEVLFELQPGVFSLSLPRGTIAAGELIISYLMQSPDPEALRTQFSSQIYEIKRWIANQSGPISDFNARLPTLLRDKLKWRKNQLLQAANTVAAIERSRPGMRRGSGRFLAIVTIRPVSLFSPFSSSTCQLDVREQLEECWEDAAGTSSRAFSPLSPEKTKRLGAIQIEEPRDDHTWNPSIRPAGVTSAAG